MIPEAPELHAWFRLLMVLIYTLGCLMLLIRLSVSFYRDHGWPWHRKPEPDHRSLLDMDVTIAIGLFLILGVLSTSNAIRLVERGSGIPLTRDSITITLYTVFFNYIGLRIWVHMNHERGNRW